MLSLSKVRSFSMPRLGLMFVGLISIASAVSLPGCGKQGEGMRCEFPPDCEDGLMCRGGATSLVCCPSATGGTGACAEGSAPADSGGETTPTTDSATTETGSDSGAPDGTTDGTTDGATDTDTTDSSSDTSSGTDTGTASGDAADAG